MDEEKLEQGEISLDGTDEQEKLTGETQAGEKEKRYPTRNRRQPTYLEDYQIDECNLNVDCCYKVAMGVPLSYEQAMHSDDSEGWKRAMESEMESLRDNQVYTAVPRPERKNVIGGKWVYNLKEASGVVKHKARYVARGFNQIQGIDYDETFSPTVNMTSVRLLMQLSVQFDMSVHQLDMKTAYLNAPLEHELYIEQPVGFATENERKVNVWKLRKSLYGLKQSGRNWHFVLREFLGKCGFVQTISDPCVLMLRDDKSFTVLLVWVDDILVASSDEMVLESVKEEIGGKFKMTDFGEISYFLGIHFKKSGEEVSMSQSKYVQKVLERFGMSKCKPQGSPSELKMTFVKDSPYLNNPSLYREMIGNLMYLMTSTRPDLAFVVTQLSQFLKNPTSEHMTCVKRVFRYLQGTQDQTLKFVKSEALVLTGYCDSDWANALDRKSIGGYCFSLNPERGGLLSWRCKKQPVIALSTCEAEYIALCNATREGVYLKQLLSEIGINMDRIVMYGDNQGALALAQNPIKRERTKHVDIKFHYIRSQVETGILNLKYVKSNSNVADIFTKPATKAKLIEFSPYIFCK
jgi:hypothetical protein